MLDQAISKWRRQVAAGGIRAPEILDELESHLRDELEKQMRTGLSARQAFEAAVRQMGETAALKSEFNKAVTARRALLRKRLLRFLGVAVVFFIAIASFGYLAIFPAAIRAQGQYAAWLGISNVEANSSFLCRFGVGTGLALAIPVGLLGLFKMGVLSYRKLVGLRPYMIVANFILGAVLTTPEVVNQIIMFVPLQLLCEASIFITGFWERRAQKHA